MRMFRNSSPPVLFVAYLGVFGAITYFVDHKSVVVAVLAGLCFATAMTAIRAVRLRHSHRV
jgi:hypothetical protein